MTSTPLTVLRPRRAALVAPLLATIALMSSCGGGGRGGDGAVDAADPATS